jgi:hypothetical protein
MLDKKWRLGEEQKWELSFFAVRIIFSLSSHAKTITIKNIFSSFEVFFFCIFMIQEWEEQKVKVRILIYIQDQELIDC